MLTDFGLEGCSHAQSGGNRQVLLVDRESLEAMQWQPGMLREIHDDRWPECERPAGGAAAPHWRSAPGSRHRLHALRPGGESGRACARKSGVAAECYVGYSKAESSALAIRLKNSRDR